ncbi:cation transporting ATPase C-terminal domain-containing protein [Streptomyces sp. NPDC057429]|uniref:cation transporting ATPase C-terminal domain-containing protein n=1 Tax=Streptomyces sp. NPDC057429 TaxID=3346130 RepID=UPI0036749827
MSLGPPVSAGAVPLPLAVLQILAIDLGTETLPALALGRERSEPGIMQRLPRPRHQGVISRDMLVRSWGYLGLVSASKLAFTAALVYAPPLQHLFGTAALPLDVVLLIATFPVLVWGADELRRARRRRQRAAPAVGS